MIESGIYSLFAVAARAVLACEGELRITIWRLISVETTFTRIF